MAFTGGTDSMGAFLERKKFRNSLAMVRFEIMKHPAILEETEEELALESCDWVKNEPRIDRKVMRKMAKSLQRYSSNTKKKPDVVYSGPLLLVKLVKELRVQVGPEKTCKIEKEHFNCYDAKGTLELKVPLCGAKLIVIDKDWASPSPPPSLELPEKILQIQFMLGLEEENGKFHTFKCADDDDYRKWTSMLEGEIKSLQKKPIKLGSKFFNEV